MPRRRQRSAFETLAANEALSHINIQRHGRDCARSVFPPTHVVEIGGLSARTDHVTFEDFGYLIDLMMVAMASVAYAGHRNTSTMKIETKRPPQLNR